MSNQSVNSLAYILFDGITLLDFIGAYDPLSRIKSQKWNPEFTWDICALQPMIKDSFGLSMKVDKVKPDLSGYDAIYVPGGYGTRPLQKDEEFVEWLKSAQSVPYKISVCTGSLLLGAAGFLTDKKATTHFNEYETLAPYCKEVIQQDIVNDQDVITGGAVASSLDLGLYLAELWVGEEAKNGIQKSMHYTSC